MTGQLLNKILVGQRVQGGRGGANHLPPCMEEGPFLVQSGKEGAQQELRGGLGRPCMQA